MNGSTRSVHFEIFVNISFDLAGRGSIFVNLETLVEIFNDFTRVSKSAFQIKYLRVDWLVVGILIEWGSKC